MRILISAWTTILVWTVLLAAPVRAEEADYLLTAGDFPVSSASNGYIQEVQMAAADVVTIHVATSLAPIGATDSYADVLEGPGPVVPPGFKLPRRLQAKLRPDLESWEAATLVLEWAADHVAVDTADTGPQDAASVLDRGQGRCSGLANAAVALLRAAGFEARTISGLLVGDHGAIRHRWLECRLPGAGWVATDPTLGLWAVTPRHLTYQATVVNLPEIRVVAAGTDGLERLPRHDGRVARPNRGADFVCRLPTQWREDPPLAVLHGAGGEVRRTRLDPEARFSDLLPGRWVLEVEIGGLVVERRVFILRSGDMHSYTVEPLTRTSHQLSATDGDAPHPAVFSRLGVLDVLSSTTPRPSSRKPCWARHLTALAAKAGEKCGLTDGRSRS